MICCDAMNVLNGVEMTLICASAQRCNNSLEIESDPVKIINDIFLFIKCSIASSRSPPTMTTSFSCTRLLASSPVIAAI